MPDISTLRLDDLLSLTPEEEAAATRSVAPGQPGARLGAIQNARVKKTLKYRADNQPDVPTMQEYIEANWRRKMGAAGRSATKSRMLAADDYRRIYGSRIQ